MKNEIVVDDAMIARYLGGEATPDEAIALDNWLDDPVNKLQFNELKDAWNASYPTKMPRVIDVAKAWNGLESRQKDIKTKPKQIQFFEKKAFKVAASLLFIASVGLILFYSLRNGKQADITIESKDSLRQVTFPDQSTATLNRNTIIIYPESFDEQREVYLNNGESFFDVTPDAAKPFIIHTGLATIKVVGTSFNVVVNKAAIDVSVDEGKVFVYTQTDTVILEAGMAATLREGNPAFTEIKSNINAWAYATHKLVFNNTPLHEVFDYIEKAQDCSIHLGNAAIGNCKLSATFESVSTDYMLTLITEALNLSVITHDDRTFTVEGEGCH